MTDWISCSKSIVEVGPRSPDLQFFVLPSLKINAATLSGEKAI